MTSQHEKILELVEKAKQSGVVGNTRASIDWFRAELKNLIRSGLGSINQRTASKFGKIIRVPEIGSMMTYIYDPKTAEDLDYYDIAPLILCFNVSSKGWHGINLHYLHPEVRAALIAKIVKGQAGRLDRVSKIKVSWEILQAATKDKYIKHSVKQYLFSQLKTPISKIEGDHWKLTINLPFEKFRKATKSQVWRDSERKI